jgi:hypothetical protein
MKKEIDLGIIGKIEINENLIKMLIEEKVKNKNELEKKIIEQMTIKEKIENQKEKNYKMVGKIISKLKEKVNLTTKISSNEILIKAGSDVYSDLYYFETKFSIEIYKEIEEELYKIGYNPKDIKRLFGKDLENLKAKKI